MFAGVYRLGCGHASSTPNKPNPEPLTPTPNVNPLTLLSPRFYSQATLAKSTEHELALERMRSNMRKEGVVRNMVSCSASHHSDTRLCLRCTFSRLLAPEGYLCPCAPHVNQSWCHLPLLSTKGACTHACMCVRACVLRSPGSCVVGEAW